MVVLHELLEESSSSTTTQLNHNYDEFLSFIGIDTHLNLTDHLQQALINANITTFLDDEGIETGLSLKLELKKTLIEFANLKGNAEKDGQEPKFIEEIDSIVQPKRTKLVLEGLDLQAWLKILSYHAFNGKGPKKGYEEVSKNLMAYIHGITVYLVDKCLLTIGPSYEFKMHQFNGSYKNLPLDLPLENLVTLDMSYSNLESFGMFYGNPQQLGKSQKLTGSSSKGKRLLGSLQILNLSYCKKLHSLGGFFEFPTLEKLILSNCISLIKICESIEQSDALYLIDLSYCNEAGKLLRTIGKVKNVKILNLDGCNLGKLPIKVRDDVDLSKTLNGNNIGMNSQTSSCAIVEAIPRPLETYMICLPSSLVCLSLGRNNLSNESFPNDWNNLSMLKELHLYDNDIISLPNCVKTLPRLEKLDIYGCERLKTLEHLPLSLKYLIYYFEYDDKDRKILFDREMSPITLDGNDCRGSLFEGMYKFEDMRDVKEDVLRSLGWTNLDFTNIQSIEQESKVEMLYEFGIFNTIYRRKEMPNWISDRKEGSSISFTIPSSHNNLRGLNLCYVLTDLEKIKILWIDMRITNITKSCTWIYHYNDVFAKFIVEDVVHLSHWMFGKNEMEDGDQITISILNAINEDCSIIRECGVSFVYDENDDGKKKTEKEEENVLGYYKSWNHIIGGDLSPSQTTTGVYRLHQNRFLDDVYFHDYIGPQPLFRAFRPSM